MAIAKCVRIFVTAVADGESTQFALDLALDPYWVGASTSSGVGGAVVNWLTNAENVPTDVMMVDGASGANMAGAGSTVVIIDVPVKNAGELYEVVLDVVFA
jgi:hypothetical protein